VKNSKFIFLLIALCTTLVAQSGNIDARAPFDCGRSGGGDMAKEVYDIDKDGIVDVAASIEGGSIGAAAVHDSCEEVRVDAQGYIGDSLAAFVPAFADSAGKIDTTYVGFTNYVTAHAGGGGGASTATVIVAASDARPKSKAGADFVCNGTDDEVEIQKAIDTVAVYGGGRVILTEGNFSITGSTPIIINGAKDNIILEGQGYGTVLKLADGYTTQRNIISFPYSSPNTANVIVRNIRFHGNRGGWATGGGSTIISMTYSSICQFQSCYFDSAYNHGLLTQDCRSILITDCFFRWNKMNGTQCQNDSDIVYRNNVFYGNLAALEIYANSDWITFADNLVYGNQASGLTIGTDVGAPRIKGLFITGNVFRGDNTNETGSSTIGIARSDSFYVMGNVIDYYQYPTSILLSYATHGWISNNVMMGRVEHNNSSDIRIFGPEYGRGLDRWCIVDPINNDTLYITAKGMSGPRISGSANFSGTKLVDTLAIPGVTANSIITFSFKGTTAPTSGLSWNFLTTDNITVHCLPADTSKLTSDGYNWRRDE